MKMNLKFLEGKTPAERNKTVAALVLGSLAVVTLAYTFLFSGSSAPKKTANTNANSNSNRTTVAINGVNTSIAAPKTEIPTIQQQQILDNADITPIPENPFAATYNGGASRNIFAMYEPPPPRPPQMRPEKPAPLPSPTPPPAFTVQMVNPGMVYARQNDFTLEVGGDRFTPDSRIIFNGQEVATKFSSPQRLTGQIPAALIAMEGSRQIMVRTPDGTMFSNPLEFNVQAAPTPNYSFVGLVARKRYNNDTAMLQEKTSKQYQNVRLGETVGRFKVVSISSNEVVMQDTSLNFRHNLQFVKEGAGGSGAASAQQGRGGNPNNGFPQGFDPNMTIQYQQVPGIPNIPGQFVPQPQPQPVQKNDDEDDNN